MPTFHEFATDWLAEREPELRSATVQSYRWQLTYVLLPYFHRMWLDKIGVAEVDGYRDAQLREARRRQEAMEAGEPIRDQRGKVLRPLSAATINTTITRLGQILDVAHERGVITANPVRINPRNRKLKRVTKQLPWLEPDEVLALIEAAGRLDTADDRYLPTRRPLLATLAWAGLRIGEAIDPAVAAYRPGARAHLGTAVQDGCGRAGCRSAARTPRCAVAVACGYAVRRAGRPGVPYTGRRALNRQSVRQLAADRAIAQPLRFRSASTRRQRCCAPP
ncbi:N-terminal phage integrase SAM-like domain-containing protein [Capillimicrobium parvum]|uniref:N-terminal phage integrase SAM-like domain-containing protein n=1 Tax=Capillimicrobium parvum TaxID=2884022 RepID=UPI00216B369A|nr:N-terminal phage integrase SAM-like domain-containing protein [Capillimicrobium parvum]